MSILQERSLVAEMLQKIGEVEKTCREQAEIIKEKDAEILFLEREVDRLAGEVDELENPCFDYSDYLDLRGA